MNTGFAFDGFPSMGAWVCFAPHLFAPHLATRVHRIGVVGLFSPSGAGPALLVALAQALKLRTCSIVWSCSDSVRPQ